MLFCGVLRLDNATERDAICSQLAHNDFNSNNWSTPVTNLLFLYELPPAFELLINTPGKSIWTKMVKKAIHHYWIKKAETISCHKMTIQYLNNKIICNIGKFHPVWRCRTDPVQVAMATTKVRPLMQQYGLAATHSAGNNKKDKCPLCFS